MKIHNTLGWIDHVSKENDVPYGTILKIYKALSKYEVNETKVRNTIETAIIDVRGGE